MRLIIIFLFGFNLQLLGQADSLHVFNSSSNIDISTRNKIKSVVDIYNSKFYSIDRKLIIVEQKLDSGLNKFIVSYSNSV